MIPSDNKGNVPIAVVMISFNEAHNIDAVMDNIGDWATEVHLVDSYSTDDSVSRALERGINVVQHKFEGFGKQWNFALESLNISTPWTMKLDPDERLDDTLKASIRRAIGENKTDAIEFDRHLWFMGRELAVKQKITRAWRTGKCKFSDVLVNEHPIVEGTKCNVEGKLEHHDSPDLHHWFAKQNRYSSAEALTRFRKAPLAATPRLFGSSFERRMFLKKMITQIPLFQGVLVFIHCFVVQGAWKAGRVGFEWSKLRALVYRMRGLKFYEMSLTGKEINLPDNTKGKPDKRVKQFE